MQKYAVEQTVILTMKVLFLRSQHSVARIGNEVCFSDLCNLWSKNFNKISDYNLS